MYIEVLLPLFLDKLLTYSVPEPWRSKIVVGGRVAVNIGKSKVMSGIVIGIKETNEGGYAVKEISEVIDSNPILTPAQITLWQWIAEYYVCTLGEVMKYFLPASMRVSGQLEEDTLTYNSSQSITKRKELFVVNADVPLGSARKQKEALEYIIHHGGTIPRSELPYSAPIIKALIEKGCIAEREIMVFGGQVSEQEQALTTNLNKLTPAQQKALDEIQAKESDGKPILLHGVSGSGKTEIYLHQIAETLKNGKTALVMLPELAVTTQLIERIKECFPNRVLTYNSSESQAKRYKTYNRLLTQKATVVVGTRIAVALPFSDLGLIVVDEEHDGNYKQSDKRPYFQARDTAVMMRSIYGCGVLLVSATPSIESYYNCETGKYALVSLHERYTGSSEPKIHIIDRRHIAAKDKQVYGYRYDTRYFSKLMLTKIKENVEAGNQTLILHNRKGFSSYMECGNCSWTPQCPNCNTTLTFHKSNMTLACNHCGHRISARESCSQCGGRMILHGIGSENVEEKIAKFFPSANIARLDGESMRNYKQFKNTLLSISNGGKNIVVGTQIIAKGFNFPKATLACVVNIDTSLNYPDYKSAERTYQLITQFAGRTSRNSAQSEVVIQTSHPENELFTCIKKGDYVTMYNNEVKARKAFLYPPFSRIIKVVLRHENSDTLQTVAAKAEAEMKSVLQDCIIHIETPLVDKVRNLYILNIVLRTPKGMNTSPIKDTLKAITSHIGKEFGNKLLIDINVDI